MKFRNLLILLCLPLSAFTCTDSSNYIIKPTSNDKKTIELLSENFNEITNSMDLWAEQNNFQKSECSDQGLSPLCKKYTRKGLMVTASLNTTSNNVDIELLILNNSIDSEIENSLTETLKGNDGWILERK